MNTLLSVTAEQVKLHIDNPKRAVDLLRDLLWAESTRQGVNPFKMGFSKQIYAKDGGVDGTSIDISPNKEGLLFPGSTFYQVKWGETFNPNVQKQLENEILTKKKKLKRGLEKLAKQKGTYVLVWFGGNLIGTQEQDIIEEIKKIFNKFSYGEIKVIILDQPKIAEACTQHTVIQSTYFNQLTEYFLTLEQWKGRFDKPDEPDRVIRLDEEDIKTIQKAVTTAPYTPIQLLSAGDKNRIEYNRWIVYGSLKENGFKQKTICIDATGFQTPLSTTLESRTDLNQIIVIDNCKEADCQSLIDRLLGERTSRLGLIILAIDGGVVNDKRFAFIGRQGLRDSKFVKQVIGQNDETKITTELLTTTIPEQQKLDLPKDLENIYGSMAYKYGQDFLNKTKRTLRFLALFSKIGSEVNLTPELRFLFKKLELPTWLDFIEIIRVLREYKTVEGNYYLLVANDNFRNYLIQEWWEIYGVSVDFTGFLKDIYIFSEDLATRLIDSVPYITATESGKRVTQALLGDAGIYSEGNLFEDEFGARLFGKLAEADPELALKCLQKTIGTWDKQQLFGFTIGRREVIWSLEKIAMWKDLFAGATRLLLALGEAENETWSNNASGVFTELFSAGYGSVAPTEASPIERLPILEEAITSSSKERRLLALRACGKALESQFFSRTTGNEKQGLRKLPQLWTPHTYGDLWNTYKEVWKFLFNKVDSLEQEDQKVAVEKLLQNTRGLLPIPILSNLILDDITELSKKPFVDKREVIETVEKILHYGSKELQLVLITRLETLKNELIGCDFHSLLRRYVGMDLLEDKFDDDGNSVDKSGPEIKKLAEQIIKDNKLIESELVWLMTEEAKNGYRLGQELGQLDKKFELLKSLIKTFRNIKDADDFFIGGYLHSIYERDKDKWELLLDDLAKDKKVSERIPYLTFRSGMSDKAALRVLELVNKGLAKATSFWIFKFGSVIKDLSEKVFIQWIEFLLKAKEDSVISIALDLYHFFYLRKESKYALPQDLTLRLLSHKSLYKKPENGRRDQMDDYYWQEIGSAYVEKYSDKTLSLAEIILANYGEEGGILDDYHSKTEEVINGIVQKHPKDVWEMVTKYLGPPIDSRAFHIKEWLRGSRFSPEGEAGTLPLFDTEDVWKWVDEDIEKRAWYLADFAPKLLFKQDGKVCWAREVLVKYGDRDDVSKELMSNFFTEGWSGSESLHYQEKKNQLLNFKKGEDNEKVRQWLDNFIALLDKYIEHAKIEEERRGY